MVNHSNSVLFRNKKANVVLEILTVLITLVVLSIVFFTAYKTYQEINVDLQGELTGEALESHNTLYAKYPKFLDGIIPVILVFFWIGAIIASTVVDTHPIFLVLTIVLLLFVVVGIASTANATQELLDDSDFDSVRDSFPITYWCISHLVQILLAMSFTVMIALFARKQ